MINKKIRIIFSILILNFFLVNCQSLSNVGKSLRNEKTRTTDEFFCSAFVSYALTQAGVLNENTDWTIISPAELSSDNDMNIPWIQKYSTDTKWPEDF